VADNFAALLEATAHGMPAKLGLAWTSGVMTYEELDGRASRWAGALAARGTRPGDRLALRMPNGWPFVVALFGGLKLGATVTPLNHMLTSEECAGILADLAPDLVVTEVDHEGPRTRAVTPLSSPALTLYTSGSTGHPRGVMLTHKNVVSTIHFMAEAAGITVEDRVVSWLPLYHDMGLIGCALTPPLLGTPIWLLPPDLRNPRQWLSLITEIRATFTVSPDFGYRNCVRNVRDTAGLDLSSLKAALSGAEPVRPSTIEAFESHFALKHVISPCYGLAEATLAVAIWPRGAPLRLDTSGRFLSVGQPCRGVSVRILAPRDEAPAAERPVGVEGEVCVKSPGVMQGYYNNPGETAKVLMPGGWLRTGDLGFVDTEGFLYVTGRLKDLIILGGVNVIPADIEEVVDRVDGVRYSAAVGIDSERTGTQRLHVVVEVRSESASPDDYHEIVREITSRVHKALGHRPARVILVQASTIPKTSSGKIQRSRLAQMIQDGELGEQVVYGDT